MKLHPGKRKRDKLFNELIIKQNSRCLYCNKEFHKNFKLTTPLQPTIDHKIPIKKGGKEEKSNYVLACRDCNVIKGNKTIEEFRQYMKPFEDGNVARKDLSEFFHYLKLKEKYKNIPDY